MNHLSDFSSFVPFPVQSVFREQLLTPLISYLFFSSFMNYTLGVEYIGDSDGSIITFVL
jgi:hypothetical protein